MLIHDTVNMCPTGSVSLISTAPIVRCRH